MKCRIIFSRLCCHHVHRTHRADITSVSHTLTAEKHGTCRPLISVPANRVTDTHKTIIHAVTQTEQRKGEKKRQARKEVRENEDIPLGCGLLCDPVLDGSQSFLELTFIDFDGR